MNFYKHYHAKATEKWVQRQNKFSVHPALSQEATENTSAYAEAWKGIYVLKHI